MWPTTDENFKGIPSFVTFIKMWAKYYIGLSVKTTNIASFMRINQTGCVTYY